MSRNCHLSSINFRSRHKTHDTTDDNATQLMTLYWANVAWLSYEGRWFLNITNPMQTQLYFFVCVTGIKEIFRVSEQRFGLETVLSIIFHRYFARHVTIVRDMLDKCYMLCHPWYHVSYFRLKINTRQTTIVRLLKDVPFNVAFYCHVSSCINTTLDTIHENATWHMTMRYDIWQWFVIVVVNGLQNLPFSVFNYHMSYQASRLIVMCRIKRLVY